MLCLRLKSVCGIRPVPITQALDWALTSLRTWWQQEDRRSWKINHTFIHKLGDILIGEVHSLSNGLRGMLELHDHLSIWLSLPGYLGRLAWGCIGFYHLLCTCIRQELQARCFEPWLISLELQHQVSNSLTDCNDHGYSVVYRCSLWTRQGLSIIMADLTRKFLLSRFQRIKHEFTHLFQ